MAAAAAGGDYMVPEPVPAAGGGDYMVPEQLGTKASEAPKDAKDAAEAKDEGGETAAAGPAEAEEKEGEQKEEQGDEEGKRGNWSSDVEFVMACMGCVIGVGNTVRFPYLVHKHGSGFVLAYWALVVLVALPLLVWEMGMGQFSSLGPVHIWRNLMPALEGVGWGVLAVQSLMAVYYSGIFSLSIFYAFSSLTGPWKRCEPEAPWNTAFCFDVASYQSCLNANLPPPASAAEEARRAEERWYVKTRCYHSRSNVSQLLGHLAECLADAEAGERSHWQLRSRDPSFHDCSFLLRLSWDEAWGPGQLFRLHSSLSEPPYERAGCHVEQGPASSSIRGIFKVAGECGERDRPWEEGQPGAWSQPSCRHVFVPLNRRDDRVQPVQHWKTAHCLQKLLELGREEGQNPEWDLEWMLRYHCARNWPSRSLISCARETVAADESFSSEEYLDYHAAAQAVPDDLFYVPSAHRMSWKLVLSSLLGWTLCGLIIYMGVNFLGKLAYFTALFPFLMVVVLVVVAGSLPGFSSGLGFYLSPRLCSLGKPGLWSDALSQVFISKSLGVGSVISLASYSDFQNDVVRDALVIGLSDGLFSFLSGLGVFGVLGYMSTLIQAELPQLLSTDYGVSFVAFSQATAMLPGGDALAFFFYAMLVLLAVDTEVALVESLQTFLLDEVPGLREAGWGRGALCAALCGAGWLLALPLQTAVGLPLITALDRVSFSFLAPAFSALALLLSVYVYGLPNLSQDMAMMAGAPGDFHSLHLSNLLFNSGAKWWVLGSWSVVGPLGLLLLLVVAVVEWGKEAGAVEERVGHLQSPQLLFIVLGLLGAPLLLVAGAVNNWFRGGGRELGFPHVLSPTPLWGPALPENRQGDRYSPEDLDDPDLQPNPHTNSNANVSNV